MARTEKDFLGEVQVPDSALYGAQTQRAVGNFPISGLRSDPELVRAAALVKKAAALENLSAGRLDEGVARAIVQAADEVADGRHADQFVVDAFQAGAGTSFHMNVNEVIANRAAELLGAPRGACDKVHPNDHVNLGQSTNDVFPTAMRLAALALLRPLLGALRQCSGAFSDKAEEFRGVVKSGRTHLQDAAPLTLGQEFGAYAKALEKCGAAVERAAEDLRSVGLGGSAVGTGLTAHPGYRAAVVAALGEMADEPLAPSADTFEAMQSMAPFVRLSGELRALAVEVGRVCNDLRLLSSGPNTGLAEIALPAVQPGSSIMPGKVNPGVCECANMVCFHVMAADQAVALAAQAGQMELNAMMPLIAFHLLLSLRTMGNALAMLADKCVRGIQADPARCARNARASLGLATLLKTAIGYHAAAELAREAADTGKSIGDLAAEKGLLTPERLEQLLSPESLDPDRPVG